jgi:hypothetical protein
MFLGDFNMPIQESQSLQQLYESGYQHLEHLHLLKHGTPMPKTCYEATIPDSAVTSPHLIPHLKSIDVDKSKLFDCRDPVWMKFSFPTDAIHQPRIRLPKPWTDLPISAQDIAAALPHSQWYASASFDEWCTQVETLIDQVIRDKHRQDPDLYPTKRLPKAFRGKGQVREVKTCPLQSQVKKGRQGDYEPPGEVHAIATKRQVTQPIAPQTDP